MLNIINLLFSTNAKEISIFIILGLKLLTSSLFIYIYVAWLVLLIIYLIIEDQRLIRLAEKIKTHEDNIIKASNDSETASYLCGLFNKFGSLTIVKTASEKWIIGLTFGFSNKMFNSILPFFISTFHLKENDYKTHEYKGYKYLTIYNTLAIYLFLTYVINLPILVYKENFNFLIKYFNISSSSNYNEFIWAHYLRGLLDNDLTTYHRNNSLTSLFISNKRVDVITHLKDSCCEYPSFGYSKLLPSGNYIWYLPNTCFFYPKVIKTILPTFKYIKYKD